MKLKLFSKLDAIPIVGIVIIAGLSLYFYQHFPAIVPSHWGLNGQVNGYMSRAMAAFLLPAVILGIYLLLSYIPLLDPHKERYVEFKKPYIIFKILIVLFLSILYVIVGLYGVGYYLPVAHIVPVMVGILFIIIGNYMGKIKNNWFIGIRNPWTLSDENVWNKTHRLGGKCFMLGGLLLMIDGFVSQKIQVPLFISAILIAAVVPMVYSFVLYKRTKIQ